jgi:Flp pilus assembly protein TadD
VNEPTNGDAQLVFVRGLLASGDLPRAAVELKQLLARNPTSASAHTELGMLLGRQRNFTGARSEFERALELQPGELEAVGGLIATDLATGNVAGARARADAQVESNPTAPALALAGRTYASGGDLATAERLFRRAIGADSGFLAAYEGLGRVLVQQGKVREARLDFEALASRSSAPVPALTMVGLLLQIEGDQAGARDRFEHVLRIDPEAAVAANNLAWIYAVTGGNLDVALQWAQTAARRLPGVAEVNDTLGFIYYKKNLSSLAVSRLKSCVTQQPHNPVFQYHLGLAYAGSGDEVQARVWLTRALAQSSNFEGAEDARQTIVRLGAVARSSRK